MGYADHRQITILQGLPTRNCNPRSTKSSPKTNSWTLPPQNEEERHLQITRTLGFKLLVFRVRPQPGLEVSSVDQDAILMLEDLICHVKQLNFVGENIPKKRRFQTIRRFVHKSSHPFLKSPLRMSNIGWGFFDKIRKNPWILPSKWSSDEAPCLLRIPHAEQPAERRSATNRDLWMSWASRKRTWFFFTYHWRRVKKIYTCTYLLKTFDYRHQAVL